MSEIAAENSPIGKERFLIAICLGMLAGIGPLCTDFYLPALPQVAASLQASASEVQLSLTASLIGIAAGQVFIGPISDMRGRRMPLLVSLTIFLITSLLCAASGTIMELVVWRFMQGIAGAGGIVLSRAIACDLYSGSDLTEFFSLLMLINGIAPILSPVAGGQILKFTDWSGIFIVLSVLSLVIFTFTWFGVKESLPVERRKSGGIKEMLLAFGHLFQDKRFTAYALVHSFIIGGLFGYIAASPFVLQGLYGLSAENFSLCFAVNGIGIMIAAQLTGKMSGRFGEKGLLKFGLTLALVASLAILFVSYFKISEIWSIVVPLFIMVSCIGITTTTSFALAIQTQRNAAGSASGLLGVIAFLFGAIASPLVGIGGGASAVPMGIVLVSTNLIAFLINQKMK